MSEAFKEAMENGIISQEPLEYSELHLKDFKKSGLSIETVRKADYKSEKEGWTVSISNPFTKEEYYRRKRLDEPIIESNGKKTEKKQIRYLSPKGCEPHLYFSLQVENWAEVLKQLDRAVIFTEGEVFTACASSIYSSIGGLLLCFPR